MLNQGADGIGKLQNEARKLGLEISTNTGKRAEEFNDNLTRMKSAFQGIGLQVATEMLPALNSVSGALVQLATDTEGVSVTIPTGETEAEATLADVKE
jgi:hypothetical protein